MSSIKKIWVYQLRVSDYSSDVLASRLGWRPAGPSPSSVPTFRTYLPYIRMNINFDCHNSFKFSDNTPIVKLEK